MGQLYSQEIAGMFPSNPNVNGDVPQNKSTQKIWDPAPQTLQITSQTLLPLSHSEAWCYLMIAENDSKVLSW